jgi:hypothetical protein
LNGGELMRVLSKICQNKKIDVDFKGLREEFLVVGNDLSEELKKLHKTFN